MTGKHFSGSISEKKTREDYIDPELKRRKWLWKYVKEEVNSVKSDFANKMYVTYDDHPEKGVDRFIDYLLLDEDYSVLAVVEAKKFSKDVRIGRTQARTYAKDIEEQIGKKVPIFLTNGKVWRFIDEDGIERKVSGVFSQQDLKRRCDLYSKRRKPSDVHTNPKIVDRTRSITIVRKLSEHFTEGHRKALVQMATGTGKTRVAMALIDVLINANYVRNVLFIADRTALVDQALSDNFLQYFTEPIGDLREGFTTSKRLYASTVQTLMTGNKKRFFEKFSPGFFDLIIFDEAHRSYYDKNNLINKYFDAIKIGLTATPREAESKNTYDLFVCERGKPTVSYSYDEAIIDKVLVPYKAWVIDTDRLRSGVVCSQLSEKLKDDIRRQEVNPEVAEYSGSEFDKKFMDNKTNEVIIREFLKGCYRSNEGRPSKSIFFCASQRHAKLVKEIFGKVAPKLSNDVQEILSENYRSKDEVKRFRAKSEPRIALSVGILDTGVDIPEVCNLVFIKPVFSSIRFWQMVGRGTRNFNSCKNVDWLPNKDKTDFLIFDFKIGGYSNIEEHQFLETKEQKVTKDVVTRIFENRVKLLDRHLEEEQKEIISKKIISTINELDDESFVIRERLPVIKKIRDQSFNLQKYVNDLLEQIAPLIIFNQGENVHISSFILQVEKLFGYVLDNKLALIDKIRLYVKEMCENILQRDTLTDIKENRSKIIRVLQESFWEDITFSDVEFLVLQIAPLMRYYQPNPTKIVQIDAPDMVILKEQYVKEVKEDKELKDFLEKNPIIKKIKDGSGITSPELVELELQLSALKPELTIENVQRYQKVDFIIFLRKIIGLTHDYDPKELIEYEFDRFIVKSKKYNSKQLEFLQLLKKIFANRKKIQLSDFGKPPLSDEHPLSYFQMSQLNTIISECNEIKIR